MLLLNPLWCSLLFTSISEVQKTSSALSSGAVVSPLSCRPGAFHRGRLPTHGRLSSLTDPVTPIPLQRKPSNGGVKPAEVELKSFGNIPLRLRLFPPNKLHKTLLPHEVTRDWGAPWASFGSPGWVNQSRNPYSGFNCTNPAPILKHLVAVR